MKKFLSIIIATLLAVSVFTGCAKQTSLPEKASVPAQVGELASKQTATPTSEGVPTNTSAAYAKLIAYKTEGYGQQSVADFNTVLASNPDELTDFLAAVADVSSSISPNDEDYDFFATTMTFSSHELYCEHMGEEFTLFVPMSKQSRPCDYVDEYGETVYDFNCFVEANVAYSINNPKLVTVAERDKMLLTFREEMQNYLNGLSEEEVAGGNIKTMLTDKSAELAKSLSTENMELSPCEVYLIETNGEAETAK